ncbi:phage tail assembly chaperone [Xinfangfangia sp. D13-10-4-6]|uniref:rcc01693 family protein n=1 Tax=Pseudogemmobacter hezensis TaxID=2737662 RepID=UPI0015534005|nr:rcc01693 family protein [Pseudogemmobacter hezensis]NPD15369.1 phage tail assembly chaperone [Pseudogemmobacter hezensis]
MSRKFDWPGLIRAGLHGLGLEPAVFWALTPVELRIMLGAERGAPPLTRARLAELAASFPDRVQGSMKGVDDGGNGSAGGSAFGA